MKSSILTIGMYLLAFPCLFIIVDFVQGKDLNWIMYLKFDIGVIIGGVISITTMWLISKFKLNTIASVLLGFVLFGLVLGLLMRSGILDFLK